MSEPLYDLGRLGSMRTLVLTTRPDAHIQTCVNGRMSLKCPSTHTPIRRCGLRSRDISDRSLSGSTTNRVNHDTFLVQVRHTPLFSSKKNPQPGRAQRAVDRFSRRGTLTEIFLPHSCTYNTGYEIFTFSIENFVITSDAGDDAGETAEMDLCSTLRQIQTDIRSE